MLGMLEEIGIIISFIRALPSKNIDSSPFPNFDRHACWPKPFSELGEHNDFHQHKRRLSYILSIAISSAQIHKRVIIGNGHTADRKTVGVSTLVLFCP